MVKKCQKCQVRLPGWSLHRLHTFQWLQNHQVAEVGLNQDLWVRLILLYSLYSLQTNMYNLMLLYSLQTNMYTWVCLKIWLSVPPIPSRGQKSCSQTSQWKWWYSPFPDAPKSSGFLIRISETHPNHQKLKQTSWNQWRYALPQPLVI